MQNFLFVKGKQKVNKRQFVILLSSYSCILPSSDVILIVILFFEENRKSQGVRTLKDMYARITDGEWQESTGTLKFSCEEVRLALHRDETGEGSFLILGEPGEQTEGYVSCEEERMECLTSFFSCSGEKVEFRFSSAGMEEGEECRGCFLIRSRQGEYELPFLVEILFREPEGAEGTIDNLLAFTRLARNSWGEAVKLFYSPDFIHIVDKQDKKYRDLYRGLSRYAGREQNVEEFLVSAQKKQPVEFALTEKSRTINCLYGQREQRCESLKVVRNGWGYTCLRVETEGVFLTAEKRVLRDVDFLGNQCSLALFISPDKLHEGKNFGRVILRHSRGSLTLPVTVIRERERRSFGTGRRMEQKRLTLELVRLYQNLKMKKINASGWRQQTAEIAERLRRLDDRSVTVQLYRAHLLITQERYEEAGRILNGLQADPAQQGPEIYCYYLYLSALYRRDEEYQAQVLERTEDMHRAYPDSWRIAWLLLYLSPTLGRSASRRWTFLEEQFGQGGTSPVMYLEALHLMNLSPTLVKKLGTYEQQLLRYGVRNDMLSDDLIGHVVYLAEREKYYSASLFRILTECYEKKPGTDLLRAICTLLIKGNKCSPDCCGWYRLGVEKELRVTRLYEYFILSADPDRETEIPRIVLMYFAYQSNLEQDRSAWLYAYVHRHREEMPDLYEAYRGQMERFVLQQLYRGRMDRNLACLYQGMLEDGRLTEDNAKALVPLLFLRELNCEKNNGENPAEGEICRAVVIHSRLEKECICPVENGRAFVPVYDRDAQILLEDGDGNRYASGKTWVLNQLLYPAAHIRELEALGIRDRGLDLYCCESRKGKIAISQGNAEHYRNLAAAEGVASSYARAVRMKLLAWYETGEDPERLEEAQRLLEELNREDVARRDRGKAVGFLVAHGLYEKAYEWMEGLDPERTEETILLRLCSRLLENGLFTGKSRMLRLAYSAFRRGKYDAFVLEELVGHFRGSCRDMEQVRDAAVNFSVDDYPITEALIVCLLYTGQNVMERSGLLKNYLRQGGKSELAAAFLHRCSGLYLMKEVRMDHCILKEMGAAAARREPLSDMCALAYLDYYARHRDERCGEVDRVITGLGGQLMEKDMKLPLFKEYVDILEDAEALLDKAMVVFRGKQEQPVQIRYRILAADERRDSLTPFHTCRMQHIYAGIYTAGFVLFAGEILQYSIVPEGSEDKEDCLDSGELKTDETNGQGAESRYGLINRMVSERLLGERGESQELFERYRKTEWMIEGLFVPMK